ncbi:hypothetical protein Tco_0424689 [Tanacetum coccineum]
MEEKVRKFGLFYHEDHKMNYNNLAGLSIHPGMFLIGSFSPTKVLLSRSSTPSTSMPSLDHNGLRDVAVYYHFAISTFPDKIVIRSSAFINLLHLPIRSSAPLIEDWESDSDDDCVIRPLAVQTKPKFTKINFVKSGENVKFVNKENTHRQAKYPRKSQSPRSNRRKLNGMMTQKLENVLTKSGQVPVNTAKQSFPRAAVLNSTARYVNTAASRPTVNGAKPSSNVFHKSHVTTVL